MLRKHLIASLRGSSLGDKSIIANSCRCLPKTQLWLLSRLLNWKTFITFTMPNVITRIVDFSLHNPCGGRCNLRVFSRDVFCLQNKYTNNNSIIRTGIIYLPMFRFWTEQTICFFKRFFWPIYCFKTINSNLISLEG